MPLVAIVGRPNVGKSTLFNRILGRRQAIVEDVAGVTRDRNYGAASWSGKEFTLVDTGGLDPLAEDGLFSLTKKQAVMAIEEADVLILVLDTKTGITSVDEEVAGILRKSDKPVLLAANKSEGKEGELDASLFFRFGMGNVHAISALHGSGVADLLDAVLKVLPEKDPEPDDLGCHRHPSQATPALSLIWLPHHLSLTSSSFLRSSLKVSGHGDRTHSANGSNYARER